MKRFLLTQGQTSPPDTRDLQLEPCAAMKSESAYLHEELKKVNVVEIYLPKYACIVFVRICRVRFRLLQ
jgi:hypothetical protein